MSKYLTLAIFVLALLGIAILGIFGFANGGRALATAPDKILWCHFEPNGNSQTLDLPPAALQNAGHMDASGNPLHAGDHAGECIEPTATPTPTGEPTSTPTPTLEVTPSPTPNDEPRETPTPTPEPPRVSSGCTTDCGGSFVAPVCDGNYAKPADNFTVERVDPTTTRVTWQKYTDGKQSVVFGYSMDAMPYGQDDIGNVTEFTFRNLQPDTVMFGQVWTFNGECVTKSTIFDP
jgi:hypothetical protein